MRHVTCHHHQVYYAYCWMLEHPRRLGWSGARVLMSGDSAGGNLVTGLVIQVSATKMVIMRIMRMVMMTIMRMVMMTMMPQGRDRGESESEEKAHFEHSSLSLVRVRVT